MGLPGLGPGMDYVVWNCCTPGEHSDWGAQHCSNGCSAVLPRAVHPQGASHTGGNVGEGAGWGGGQQGGKVEEPDLEDGGEDHWVLPGEPRAPCDPKIGHTRRIACLGAGASAQVGC